MFDVSRIIAANVDEPTRRLILLCGIDKKGSLVAGEWMGYVTDSTDRFPFIIRDNRLEYDGDTEIHNFYSRAFAINELFTITGTDGEDGATYRIQNIQRYSEV